VYKNVKVEGVSKYYAYFDQTAKGKYLQKIKKGQPDMKDLMKKEIQKDFDAEQFFNSTFLREVEGEKHSELLNKISRVEVKNQRKPIIEDLFEKTELLPTVNSTSKEKKNLNKSEKIHSIKVLIFLVKLLFV
jgi:hypothetical protein